MRSFTKALALVLLTAPTCGALAVSSPSVMLFPRSYIASIDSRPVTAVSPNDGRVWAAWVFRAGNETDIALSVRSVGGIWTEPVFFGRFDRADQFDPALTLDAAGNIYLAYAVRQSGRVCLTALPADGSRWLPPAAVSPVGLRAGVPSVRIVGQRLVVAFRVASRVEIADFALIAPRSQTGDGIQDGPDGVDPLGQAPPDPGGPPLDPAEGG